jgi:glycosyltransferase involved in cell wall biosynthesis
LRVSVVIPVYNEGSNLRPLSSALATALDPNYSDYELIYVDDGSTDGSSVVLDELRAENERVKVLRLRRNLGKSLALATGFSRAQGEIIITLDGDLQDDPEEIPRFVAALESGYDLVSGWRKRRHDKWHKILLSRIFNYVTCRVSGVELHDFNCGFKAYRRELFKDLKLYGHFHRFVPVLAAWRGYRVSEIEVLHHPRARGDSKYGVGRILHGFLDLLTVVFLTRFDRRPLHFLGGIGFLTTLTGFVISCYLSLLWILGDRPIGTRPLFFLGILLIIVGIQFVFFGLLAEFLLHLYLRHDEHYLEGLLRPDPRKGQNGE